MHFLSILGITILQCSIAHEILLPFNSAFRLTCASKAHAENLEGATNFSLEATCSPLAHVLLVSIPLQGHRSPRGRGTTAPLFLVDFINFTLKNAIFKINFKVPPSCFSELKVSPPLFLELPTALLSMYFITASIKQNLRKTGRATPSALKNWGAES